MLTKYYVMMMLEIFQVQLHFWKIKTKVMQELMIKMSILVKQNEKLSMINDIKYIPSD